MRRIAVINQKGGVGKTTTTVNLGAALARLGYRTLVCDLDPQCNLTVHLGEDPAVVSPSLYELFIGQATLAEVVKPTSQPGLEMIPASIDLAGVELELVNEVGREMILRHAFERDEADRAEHYDFILVDCPPSLGLLSLNALVGCDELFVPIQAEFFALQGLGKLLEIVDLVRSRLNPRLEISSMVSCRHDPSTNLSRAVIADVASHFGDIMLKAPIRRDIKLAEAPSHGKTIFEYAPGSRGAHDYLTLAQELSGRSLSTEAAELAMRQPAIVEAAKPVEPPVEPAVELAKRPGDAEPPEEDLTDGLTPAQRFLRKSGGAERNWKEAR
ncbi:MAG: AAA family ATPase [Planctomycetota bacterium]|nr:AAA family ATPase [Planctomycetota bacterium]